MKIAITGAGGFVGKHLITYLLQQPQITALVALSKESASNNLDNKVKYYSLDLLDSASVLKIILLEKPDAVIHLAALSSVGQSWQNPDLFITNNALLTENILQACIALNNNCKFLFVSSAEVYAPSKNLLKETDDLAAKNPYAASKIKCEEIVTNLCTANNINYFIARPFNHIGSGQSPNFVLPSFAQQIAQFANTESKKGVLRTGNLQVERDFTAVQDVVAAYWQILQHGKNGTIYNICSSQACSLTQVIKILSLLAQVDLSLEIDPEKLRPNDNPYIVGDNAKIKLHTQWMPQVPLNTVLQQILESYLH